MKTRVELHESLTVSILTAVLMDQRAEGDAEGAANTLRMIARVIERERRRKQAQIAGRWPFVQREAERGADDESDSKRSD